MCFFQQKTKVVCTTAEFIKCSTSFWVRIIIVKHYTRMILQLERTRNRKVRSQKWVQYILQYFNIIQKIRYFLTIKNYMNLQVKSYISP